MIVVSICAITLHTEQLFTFSLDAQSTGDWYRWNTHLTNCNYFDWCQKTNTPNWSPMPQINDSGFHPIICSTCINIIVCDTPFLYWPQERIIKGIISDSLRLRKIFKPFRNKEKYLSITTCIIFLRKSHKFDRKTAFSSDFFPSAMSTVFLHGKISLSPRIKCFSFNWTHKTT